MTRTTVARLNDTSRSPLRDTCCALLGSVPLSLGLSASAYAQDAARGQIEEIVVTGSYIKREKFDMASPVEVIGGLDVQQTGQPNIGHYVRDLTFMTNVDTVANVLDTQDGLQSSDSPNFNLRGLGNSATLTLFDGRRTLEGGSINTIVPDIAINRVEVLLDGGSALYGTDAVAGVVNVIPVKKYDGLKMSGLYNQDQDNDFHESKFAMLGGTSLGNLDVVGAFAFSEQTLLRRTERPEFLRADTDETTSGNPGTFRPVGAVTGNLFDPSCGTFNGTATDDGLAGSFPSGRRLGTFCLLEFGEWQDYARPGEEYNGYTNLSYALGDNATLELQANFIYRTSDVVQSPSTANTGNNIVLNVPASHPANPFGVAVRPLNWRPFARMGTLPSHLDDGGSFEQDFSFWTDRYKLGSTYQFGDSSWSGETWASYQTSRTRIDQFRISMDRLQAALNGLGGPNGNEYFNPFGSADPRSPFHVPGVTSNSQALVDGLYQHEKYESVRTEFWYVESIATGDLFKLPAGTLAAALGFQVRNVTARTAPSPLAAIGDSYDASVRDDPPRPTTTDSQVNSVFLEFDVPVLSNVDLQLAVRHEDFDDLGLDATKPKVSLRYVPFPSLALRASYGESFLAPTPAQIQVVQETGCTEVFTGTDPFGMSPTGLIGTRSCASGNPDLEPEESEIINVGFTWQPQGALEGLELSLDYQTIDYQGRITSLASQDLVNRDFANFLAANNLSSYSAANPADRALAIAWFQNGTDPLIVRSAPSFVVTNVTRVPENISDVEIDVLDFRGRYSFGLGSLGFLSASLSTTYYDKYEYVDFRGRQTDAAGRQNANTNVAPPIPELKHSLRLDWSRGRQNASIAVKSQKSVAFDAAFSAALTGVTTPPTKVKGLTTVDVRYSYEFADLFNGDLNVAVGANNVLDELPEALPLNGGFESRLYDPYGRILYLELTYDFGK